MSGQDESSMVFSLSSFISSLCLLDFVSVSSTVFCEMTVEDDGVFPGLEH